MDRIMKSQVSQNYMSPMDLNTSNKASSFGMKYNSQFNSSSNGGIISSRPKEKSKKIFDTKYKELIKNQTELPESFSSKFISVNNTSNVVRQKSLCKPIENSNIQRSSLNDRTNSSM